MVDLTNDSTYHHNNVVDLTRDSSTDSSIDSSPVIVVSKLLVLDFRLTQKTQLFLYYFILYRVITKTSRLGENFT